MGKFNPSANNIYQEIRDALAGSVFSINVASFPAPTARCLVVPELSVKSGSASAPLLKQLSSQFAFVGQDATGVGESSPPPATQNLGAPAAQRDCLYKHLRNTTSEVHRFFCYTRTTAGTAYVM
jgi:hypothetical protein